MRTRVGGISQKVREQWGEPSGMKQVIKKNKKNKKGKGCFPHDEPMDDAWAKIP